MVTLDTDPLAADASSVTIYTPPTSAGSLTAVVTTNTVASATPVQVATVRPVITSSIAALDADEIIVTINGFGFDATAGNNTVVFNNGAVGTVTTTSATSLEVTFGTNPTSAGSLTAVVTTDSVASGSAVRVATGSIVDLALTESSIVIEGFGFSPTAANNTVVFNNGATGTVTAATATSLTVTFGTKPVATGSLTAVINSNTVSSGAAVQVATMI